MRDKLYWSIEKFSLLNKYFLFFDVHPYLADQLFIKHKVRVWFHDEYEREDLPYVAIFCHVRKKDVPRFIEALQELRKSMMLCGYPKYEEDIGNFMDQLESKKGAVAGHENDTYQQAKQEQTA